MEKTEKKFLTAKEAKELADTSNALLNRVYKAIKEVAKENEVSTMWYVEHVSLMARDLVIADLEANGYKTELMDNNANLFISWQDA